MFVLLQYYLPLQVRELRSKQWTSLRRTFKCLPPNMNTLLPNRTAVWAARAEGLGPCHPKQIHKLKIQISPNQIHESKFQHINMHTVKPVNLTGVEQIKYSKFPTEMDW